MNQNKNQNLNEKIYFKKYLKYKSKYSNMINLVGGVPEKKIFIISSHMNRMVIKIFEMLVLMGQKVPEINFVLDNCTILKIDKVADMVTMCMLYPTVNSNPSRFRGIEQINELKLSIPMADFPADLIIYLVRHGEGFHNVPGSSIAVIHDAELTPKGKEQIIPASQAIQQDIETMGYTNYKIFLGCSHLKRTWQTVYNLYNIFSPNLKDVVHKEIFIIPCLHEMIRQMNTPQHYEQESPHKRTALNPFHHEGEYQARYKGAVSKPDITDEELRKIVLENKPRNNIHDGITERSYQETDSEPIPLNWSFYEDTHIRKGITYEQCADITVIKAICNFYDYLKTNSLF
jgi:bisphosphoglycerate-dependent phosphoglycerate mutase